MKDILHASLELTSSEFVLLFTVCFLSFSVLLEAMQCRASTLTFASSSISLKQSNFHFWNLFHFMNFEVWRDQEERSHSCLGSCPLCDWPTLSTERSIFRFSLTVFLRRQKAHFLRRDFNRRSCGRLSIPVTNKADSRHKMRSIARERKPHIRVTLALLLVNLTAKMTNIERVENAPRLWKWKFGLKVKVLGLSKAGGGKTRH